MKRTFNTKGKIVLSGVAFFCIASFIGVISMFSFTSGYAFLSVQVAFAQAGRSQPSPAVIATSNDFLIQARRDEEQIGALLVKAQEALNKVISVRDIVHDSVASKSTKYGALQEASSSAEAAARFSQDARILARDMGELSDKIRNIASSYPGVPQLDGNARSSQSLYAQANVSAQKIEELVREAYQVLREASSAATVIRENQVQVVIRQNPYVAESSISPNTQQRARDLESFISVFLTAQGKNEAKPEHIEQLRKAIVDTAEALAQDISSQVQSGIESRRTSPFSFSGFTQQTFNTVSQPFSARAREREYAGYSGFYTTQYVLNLINEGVGVLKNAKPIIQKPLVVAVEKPKTPVQIIVDRFSQGLGGSIGKPSSTSTPAIFSREVDSKKELKEGEATTSLQKIDLDTPTVRLQASSDFSSRSTTLSWEGVNVARCEGQGFETKDAVKGSVQVTQTKDTTYSIVCSGPKGSRGSSLTISVPQESVVSQKPPLSVQKVKGRAIITWTTAFDKCTITGTDGFSYVTSSTTGSVQTGLLKPGTTNYSITCEVP